MAAPSWPARRRCNAALASAAAPAARRGQPARLADRGRPGAVELPGALRAGVERRTLPGESAGDVERELAGAAGALRARPTRGSRPSCARGSCASRSRSTRRPTSCGAARRRRGPLGAAPEIVGARPGWTPRSSPPPASRPSSSARPARGPTPIEEYVELESVGRWPRSSSRPPARSAHERTRRRRRRGVERRARPRVATAARPRGPGAHPAPCARRLRRPRRCTRPRARGRAGARRGPAQGRELALRPARLQGARRVVGHGLGGRRAPRRARPGHRAARRCASAHAARG